MLLPKQRPWVWWKHSQARKEQALHKKREEGPRAAAQHHKHSMKAAPCPELGQRSQPRANPRTCPDGSRGAAKPDLPILRSAVQAAAPLRPPPAAHGGFVPGKAAPHLLLTGDKGSTQLFLTPGGEGAPGNEALQGAGAGGGGRRKAEAQAGSTTMKENPLGGTVPAALPAGTPAVPSTGRSTGGQRSTARQEVAFRGEADCD